MTSGRANNAAGLDLPAVGIRTNAQVTIQIDEAMRTALFSTGDYTDQPQFVYVAAAASVRLGINMTGVRHSWT